MEKKVKNIVGRNKNPKERLRQAYMQASESSLIRAGIEAIPAIGGPLAELLFSKAKKIKEKRLLKSLRGLRKICKGLENNKIDKDYLKSEAFLSLSESVFRQIINESKEEKRKIYQHILKNASLIKFKGFDKELLLNLLTNITQFHLQLLRDCNSAIIKGDFISLLKLYKIRGVKIKKRRELLDHLYYLSSLGLLNKTVQVEVDGSAQEGYLQADAETEENFTISILGKNFLSFIKK